MQHQLQSVVSSAQIRTGMQQQHTATYCNCHRSDLLITSSISDTLPCNTSFSQLPLQHRAAQACISDTLPRNTRCSQLPLQHRHASQTPCHATQVAVSSHFSTGMHLRHPAMQHKLQSVATSAQIRTGVYQLPHVKLAKQDSRFS